MSTSPFASLSRRQILQLAALMGGAATLAACGGPAVGEAGGAASEQATDWASVTPAKEITWWSNHPGTSKDLESKIIEDFAKETGIKVNLVTAGANYDEVAQSEEDDVVSALHGVTVDLGLDLGVGNGHLLEGGNVNLGVEVADVAKNDVVAHLVEVRLGDDIVVTGGGDDDVGISDAVLNSGDLVALHGGLESVDGVDLGDDDTGAEGAEGSGATLSDITVAGNDGGLTSNHDIGGALDTIDKRLTAAVEVVELGLGDGVVDVDGGGLAITCAFKHGWPEQGVEVDDILADKVVQLGGRVLCPVRVKVQFRT